MQEITLKQSLACHPSGITLEAVVVSYDDGGGWESSLSRTRTEWTLAGSVITESAAIASLGTEQARQMYYASGSQAELRWHDGDWDPRPIP